MFWFRPSAIITVFRHYSSNIMINVTLELQQTGYPMRYHPRTQLSPFLIIIYFMKYRTTISSVHVERQAYLTIVWLTNCSSTKVLDQWAEIDITEVNVCCLPRNKLTHFRWHHIGIMDLVDKKTKHNEFFQTTGVSQPLCRHASVRESHRQFEWPLAWSLQSTLLLL